MKLEEGFKFENISSNEMIIIEALRTLKPFEQVIITADKQGKIDNYLMIKSSKIILNHREPFYVA